MVLSGPPKTLTLSPRPDRPPVRIHNPRGTPGRTSHRIRDSTLKRHSRDLRLDHPKATVNPAISRGISGKVDTGRLYSRCLGPSRSFGPHKKKRQPGSGSQARALIVIVFGLVLTDSKRPLNQPPFVAPASSHDLFFPDTLCAEILNQPGKKERNRRTSV